MTISEALNAIDALRPNMFTEAEKIAWLSECDGLIWNDVLLMRQIPTEEEIVDHPFPPEQSTEGDTSLWLGKYDPYYAFSGYTSATRTFVDPETEEETEVPITLLVPYPYDRDVYTYYLMMKVDEGNAEFDKYNQSSKLFNNALLTYRNFVNRQRTPTRNAGTVRFWW